MRGLFVTGTDTGVGKTALAASIVAALRARGEPVHPLKPLITGLDEAPDESWPADHVLLARAGGVDPDAVALLGYGPPVSPHLAAELAGEPVDATALLARIRAAAGSPSGGVDSIAGEGAGDQTVTDDANARNQTVTDDADPDARNQTVTADADPGARNQTVTADADAGGQAVTRGSVEGAGARTVIVEGAGGLLVPIAPGFDMRDLARQLGLPLVIAARPGLGTINHSLLTIEAARSAGLRVAAVVLTPWPQSPTTVERSNWETIAGLGGVAVHALPLLSSAAPAELAAAGAGLPIEDWLG